jgi:hypothetical protein
MSEQGLIVGCDKYEEWLLPWWWEHYKKTNSYPVAFADFGMTESAKKWCQKRGELITPEEPFARQDQDQIPKEVKILWEKVYGVGIWNFRPIWFKKPLACIESPFEKNIWIDLDCRIESSLESLFNVLEFNVEIAVYKNNKFHQQTLEETGLLLPGESHYSSGIIAFRKDAPIISKWAQLTKCEPHNFSGDQEALSRAIHLEKPVVFDLPLIYNLSWELPPREDTIITHFGGQGKKRLIDDLYTR